MPRPPRISQEGLIYHIINRGNNQQNVFKDDEDYTLYLDAIKKFKKKYSFKLYGYCLMSNHTHLIIEPTKKNTLSRSIQSITLSYIRNHHAKYKSSGHLWQGRFKSSIIQSDEYLLECLKYIDLNPVRAAIVSKPEQYGWSSYRFHAFGEDKDHLLDKDLIYLSLGDTDAKRQKAYQDLVSLEQTENTIDLIKRAICNDSILGSDMYVEKLRIQLSLAKPRHRGRPKIIKS